MKESEANKCNVSPGSVLFIPANATSKVTCSQVIHNTCEQITNLKMYAIDHAAAPQESEKGLVLFQAYAGV